MMAAMGITSFLCIFIGCYTPYLYRMLPHPVHYEPYTAYHVSETLQVLLFTGLGFFLLLKKLEPEAKISLDLDWPYRMGGRAFLWLARKPIQGLDNLVGEIYRAGGIAPLMASARLSAVFDNKVIDGAVDGFAAAFRHLGGRLRTAQRGTLQENLTFSVGIAAAVVVALVLIF
jgi:multicomponent Na+:H+ antiporter subunit D